ncbi:FAD-binding oxidoreductase [Microbacterium sp. MPKO10]|uniref:FAD-binding oxidoreductase n=1 Tax=Microbacterium sp. MPKO10 TaxID=2989818 RepID=UPI00223622D6|nr:FAD-binding oxidoreductase [Microbacterium sp. MPKO10]MCW4457020.1 FAD-binding oxidoreductase [Microbacterium sp. MPKO10]
MTSSRITSDAAELSNLISGPVLVRGDPHFSDEVTGQNLWLEHNPDIVVGVESENDIVEAVRFALAHNLTIHVQATGHGTRESINSGMLISTRRFATVSIDPASRTATIGAGARWRAVANDAAPHGLAPITGSAPGVGVVGFLLGGGLGPLARSHGFGSDWVRSIRIVTGTGELVTASDNENPELFWALRGGKSGFGIVTEVTIELAEIPSLYAGSMMYSADHVNDMLRAWSQWTRDVPENVTSSAAIMRFPDVEQVPAAMRGATVLSIRVAAPVTESEGEAIVAPLREAAPTMVDEIGMMALTDTGKIHNDPEDPTPMHGWTQGYSLSSVDDAFVETFISAFGTQTATPLTSAELRHIGSSRNTPNTAAGGRDGEFLFSVLGISPVAQDEVFASAAAQFLTDIEPWRAAQSPVNFLGETPLDELPARAWAPEVADRLSALRRTMNPRGLIHGLQ